MLSNGTRQLLSSRRTRSVLALLLLVLASHFCLSLLTTQAHAAQVTLAWDESSSDTVRGYKLYYGTSSNNYTTSLDVGLFLTYTITNLDTGHTYYIAATAYDGDNHESAFSDEVFITFPGNHAPVAKNDTLSTMRNTHASDKLRAQDADGDNLRYRIVNQGDKGTAVILDPATGTYTYSPAPKSTGADTFSFVANDGQEDSNVATVNVTITTNSSVTYESAKDKRISRWAIFDKKPAGARVRNVYDKKRHSRVIELKGNGTQNAYRMRNADGSKWHNSAQKVLQWNMSYPEKFKLYVDLKTTAGQRFITYTSAGTDKLGSGKYVYIGIGAGAIPGQWHIFARDLQADLERAQPNVQILEVNGLTIRGNLRIDEIALIEHLPCIDSDFDGISDDDEFYVYHTDPLKADTSGCGISDGYKCDYLRAGWNADTDGDGIINLLDDDMDNDGSLDGSEIAHRSSPLDISSAPSP